MKPLLLVCLVLLANLVEGQPKQVAITMDDLPYLSFSGKYSPAECMDWNGKLLEKITAMQTPVTGFVNGKGALAAGEADARLAVLQQWADNPLITPGNHTYSHANCAELNDPAAFIREVLQCEFVLESAWPGLRNTLTYFRFPYNATGRDSLSRIEWESILAQLGYVSTPFTLESSDYVFNALYVDALNKGQGEKAAAFAQQYIAHTLAVFAFYEAFCQERYGGPIRHIYLCHANQLHADHYDALIRALEKEGYEFVSLDEALMDPVYRQTDHYFGKWGFSWLYRWIEDPEIRRAELRKSPDPNTEILEAWRNLQP